MINNKLLLFGKKRLGLRHIRLIWPL